MGQFYQPLTIGTAKPDWKKASVQHHLFDVLTQPVDLNVCTYRTMLVQKIEEICGRGKLPIIVGGSLFYLKSVFFPPKINTEVRPKQVSVLQGQTLWDKLNEIDPARALALDPNDTYRIKRALALWKQTGKKPSELQPEFNFSLNFLFAFISPPREILYERINQRTEQMIKREGWIDEVKCLRGTSWETFLKRKKLIGYPEIFDWIERGEREHELDDLVRTIQAATRQYAKRQLTFWKKFDPQLKQACLSAGRSSVVMTCPSIVDTSVAAVVNALKKVSG